MTEKTKSLINALIGLERCHVDGQPDMPADDPWKWGDFTAEMRFRWAALAALEEGDAAEAGALSQLAVAASLGHIGMELFISRDET